MHPKVYELPSDVEHKVWGNCNEYANEFYNPLERRVLRAHGLESGGHSVSIIHFARPTRVETKRSDRYIRLNWKQRLLTYFPSQHFTLSAFSVAPNHPPTLTTSEFPSTKKITDSVELPFFLRISISTSSQTTFPFVEGKNLNLIIFRRIRLLSKQSGRHG